MPPKIKHFYEFKNFRIDVSEKNLSFDGKVISLTPKVFDTLLILVENAGRLLEKNELMRLIWQDRFVEESNLTFNIKMLRRALGDDAGNPRFIETVPRRGYRFIAEVDEILLEGNTQSAQTADAVPAITRKRNYFSSPAAVILFALIFCAVGAAGWFVRKKIVTPASASNKTAPVLSAPFHSEKLTHSGNVSLAAVSPDGNYVAYIDKANDKFGVWMQRLGTSERVQIVASSDDYYLGLAFSHDGKSIFFVRKPQADEQAQAGIFRVSAFGGVPAKIIENAQGWFSLSPDDRQISFVRYTPKSDDYCSLFIADADGQNERKLITQAYPLRISDNQFSPDGESIAFAVGESWSGSTEFALKKINVSNGAESTISTHKFFNIKSLKWLPDGSSLLLAAMENLGGRIKIWEMSAATGDVQLLTNDAANYELLSVNKDADKIIASEVTNDFRLYLSPAGNATKALTNANNFAFTPNGKIIYSNFDGDIWMINREGSEQRQLTSGGFSNFAPVASSDGRFVYFTSNRTGSNQIWRMDADGGNQIQLTKTEGGYPHFVSPDGKWVYYESGLHQTLWKVSSEGGGENEIYDKKVFASAFAPDGSRVAYFFRDKTIKVGIVSLKDKKLVETFDLADSKAEPVRIAWTNNSQSLKYITRNGSSNKLWLQPLAGDKPHFLTDLDDGDINDFALSPDDGSIAIIRGGWLHDAVLIDGLK